MNVAITAWEDKISPVFDAAGKLLIAEIKANHIINRSYESFHPEPTFRLTRALVLLKIDILICGAISETYSQIIEAGGIRLIPFIHGNVEQVLDFYVKGRPIVPAFLMPGCRSGFKQAGRNRFDRLRNNQKEVSPMPNRDQTGPDGKGSRTGRGQGRCKAGKGGKGSGAGRGSRQNQGLRNGRGTRKSRS